MSGLYDDKDEYHARMQALRAREAAEEEAHWMVPNMITHIMSEADARAVFPTCGCAEDWHEPDDCEDCAEASLRPTVRYLVVDEPIVCRTCDELRTRYGDTKPCPEYPDGIEVQIVSECQSEACDGGGIDTQRGDRTEQCQYCADGIEVQIVGVRTKWYPSPGQRTTHHGTVRVGPPIPVVSVEVVVDELGYAIGDQTIRPGMYVHPIIKETT